MLLMLADVLPIERDVRILCLDFSKHIGLEGVTPDPYSARRAKDIQDARALAMPLAIEVHQIGGLVSTLVPDNAQERHSALLALLRPG